MRAISLIQKTHPINFLLIFSLLLPLWLAIFSLSTQKVVAACVSGSVPTTFGQVTQTINVTSAGTYRVWSRIKAPDTTKNSYYFRVDSGCNYNVGDSASINPNTWTWVNYQDGNTGAPIDVNLSAGSHTLTYTGKEADVQLDRILLLSPTASCAPPTSTGDNCATVDDTPPTTSITAPLTGASYAVGASVTLTADARDNEGIKTVEFFDGTTPIGTSTNTSTPYSYTWNTSGATAKTYSITAKATDTSDNTTTSTPISVTLTSAAPTVSLTSPAAGNVTIGSTVTIAATALPAASITRVEFFDGTNKLNTDSSAPYSYSWNTSGATAGAHSLTAKAFTSSTNVTSAPVNINLTTGVDTTKPTNVVITSPTAGQNATVGSTVTITSTASDNVGVDRVEFYDGTNLITPPTTSTSSPYSITWNTAGLNIGNHRLTSKAYDAAGNFETSVAVDFEIKAVVFNPDLNGDGRVNAYEISVLISHDGQNYPAGDIDKDGTVGASDAAIVKGRWTW